ncbi:hypothetical protein [Paenibacillus sp. NPDC057967]|uniref:hypothetical protein n=1 Tax=Paenibacillus sp. NPDC057967 TaxID=3346293 RepID=UPI0036DB72F4
MNQSDNDLASNPKPIDYARALAGSHAELSTPDPSIGNSVLAYINSQENVLNAFATTISEQGEATETSGWARKKEVGKLGTELVYQYNWSEQTASSAVAILQGTLALVKQDASLQNKLWTVQEGVPGPIQASVPPVEPFTWTAERFGPQFGLTVQSVSADPATGAFQFVLSNEFPAFYSIYAEFADADGQAIMPAAWTSRLPEGSSAFETATLKFLGFAPPTLAIAGIPMAAKQVTLEGSAPQGTETIRLTCGTLGALGWNTSVNALPLIATGLLGYAVPWLMKGQAADPDLSWYNSLIANKGVLDEVVSAAGVMANSMSTEEALLQLQQQIGMLLFGGSLPRLLAELKKQFSHSALIDGAQGLNWPLSGLLATLPGAVSGIVQTLSVPASFVQSFSMQLIVDAVVEMRPDPAHGAYPLKAASYRMTWEADGESKHAEGTMNGIWTSSPVQASFPAVLSVGYAVVQAFVYDADGAMLAQGTLTCQAAQQPVVVLKEVAAAVGSSTIYKPIMALSFDDVNGYGWKPASSFGSATHTALDCSNTGTYLCRLTGLSYNAAMRTLVYGWRASGPGALPCGGGSGGQQLYRLQAVSVSSCVQQSLKPASCGLYTVAMIACGNGAADNLFYDNRTAPYGLRSIEVGDTTPFRFPSGLSLGTLGLSYVDDLAVHPAGFAAAVGAAADGLQIVRLSTEAMSDADAPVPVSAGGRGTREGLLFMPVAVAITPGGQFIVLEAGNRRLQAFDVFGNPYPYFGKSGLLPLKPNTNVHYLDIDIDSSGRMYLLYYQGDGTQPSQYGLDIYGADGALLTSTAGVNADKLCVDPWGNVYTLGYELMEGPEGDYVASVCVWAPFATVDKCRKAGR